MKILFTFLGVMSITIGLNAQVLLDQDQQLLKEYQWLYDTAVKHACNEPGSSKVNDTPVSQCDFMNEFLLFPNPATSEVNLKFSASALPTKIFWATIDGKVVKSQNLEKFSGQFNQEIRLNQFNKGIYIISIVQKNDVFVRKLIIE